MKSQNLAISFAIVIEQVVKLSSNEAQANKKLYQTGRQMGLRISDQFNSRQCSFLMPTQTIKAIILKITKDYLAVSLQLIEQSIKFEKRNHFYNLTYRQSSMNKSIVALCQDIDDRFSTLEPCSIIAGFIYGVLQSMDFYGQVAYKKDENSREKAGRFVVDVKKDIKQED